MSRREKQKQALVDLGVSKEAADKCPTVFQALGMKQNRTVLITFILVSVGIAAVAFGVFFAGRELIPVWFPSISRYDAPIYACGACVIASQILVFGFYFWAWRYDLRAEKSEKQKKE